jgi:predicted O-methyltransferase YrrM
VPASLRESVRRRHRGFVFSRAMDKFVKNPSAALESEDRLLQDLIYGWGSDWSALDEYLRECLRHALVCEGPILECGSGLTTVLVGAIAKKRKLTMWSLEHLPEWGQRVTNYTRKFGIDSINVSVKGLRTYPEFAWYDPPLDSMPDTFALVICDGPPGGTPGARYGLAAVMKDRLRPGCVILLDDAAWETQQKTAARWSVELSATYTTLGSKKPYIRMILQ